MTTIIAAFNILLILFLAWLVSKKQAQDLRAYFWVALSIRVAAAIAMGLVYRYYYASGDTYAIFEEARSLTAQFYADPSQMPSILSNGGDDEYKGFLRTAFFVKIVSLVNVITYSNYWLTGLAITFVTFLCSWRIFSVVSKWYPDARLTSAVAFLLFPSVVFWSSGIIKEALALGGLYLLAATWLNAINGKRPGIAEIVVDILALWIVWNLKYYWIAIFLPIAIGFHIVQLSARVRLAKGWRISMWAGMAVIMYVGIRIVHPNFYPGAFLTVLVDNHNAFLLRSDPENLIHYYNLSPSWWSIIINAPWALFSGLFRPLPGESSSLLGWLASLENAVVLLLAVTSLYSFFRRRTPFDLIAGAVVIYTVVLAVFLALSTPNMGSLARYKVGFLPFFVFVICYQNPVVHRVLSRFRKQKNA